MNVAQKLTALILVSVIFCSTINAQTAKKSDAAVFQNQQRTIRLSSYRAEIKNLDDAPMRCFVRAQIARFIFQNEVLSHFNTANDSVLECFEEIAKNADQFSEMQRSYWSNTLLVLLRSHSPETAKEVEKKYLSGSNTEWSDIIEIDNAKDLTVVTNRVIGQLLKGDIPDNISVIIQKLLEKNTGQAYRVLDALLRVFEANTDIDNLEKSLIFTSGYFLEESVPSEFRKRFLKFAIRLGQGQVQNPVVDFSNGVFETCYSILKDALPKIRESLPEDYQTALVVFTIMDAKLESMKREDTAVYARIEVSTDKLEQTILEAGSAKGQGLRDSLWLMAVHFAVTAKKFKTAADCALKVFSNIKEFAPARDNFLVNVILPKALKANDFEASDYALKFVENELEKASGTLMVAARYVELKDKTRALEYIDTAQLILRKEEPSTNGVRIMLSSVPVAMKVDKSKAFESADFAVFAANRLPSPSSEDKAGTESRNKHTDSVLIPNALNLAKTLDILAKADFNAANSTAQAIRPKPWRLAADIVLETHRVYPMPKLQDNAR
ncbi:MAG: hypothetical protein ACRD6X_16625 [Pyrinomonadaceae bacterium]